RDTQDNADLFDLIKTFKEKTDYPSDYDPIRQRLYSMITSTDMENSANVAQTLGRYLNYYKDLRKDKLLSGFANAKNSDLRNEIKEKVYLELKANNLDSGIITEIMNTLRETKTAEEMKLLKKAIEI
ncbi:MAG: aminopeptidase P family protein, partial [Flavobacteriaceae bacterium]